MDSVTQVKLAIGDIQYPMVLHPELETRLTIRRATFPFEVEITGFGAEANTAYQSYLKALSRYEQANSPKDPTAKERSLYELAFGEYAMTMAKEYLSDTALENEYLKATGEYLVNALKTIPYRRSEPDFDADAYRNQIIALARSNNFFTLASLKAQRAGIRDFTHYYARSFEIYDSVYTRYGAIAEADLKRIAYPQLNQKRMDVIRLIEDEAARAYAELFLVAERIGELPLTIAEPSYLEFLNTYASQTAYTDFITAFYKDIQSVTPGNKAIPFSIADETGKVHRLEEYEGTYVLLDFWAGWCKPCLEEFPEMRRIYAKYNREDFEILGISNEVDRDVWLYDIGQFNNPWPQLYGGQGFDNETFVAYKGGGIPFYILIDRDGNIARYNDIRATFNLESVLDSLIN
ncbi:MAG: TlpA disulfide reductase family protein [Bacteroidota bacterium]